MDDAPTGVHQTARSPADPAGSWWSGLARQVRLVLLSSHPGPTAAVTALAVVLGFAVGLSPARLALLALAIGAGQLSIGLANDWLDAARDARAGRTDKPVAQGLVSVRVVRAAAFGCVVLATAVTALLGWSAAVVHLILIASGWAYDVWLKRTVWSVLPFCVSFGLLPAVVTLSASEPRFAAPWAIAVGAIFGVSIHFTNVLPDLADDARTGVVGLPHRLGRIASGVVAFGALVLAAVVAFVGPLLAQDGPEGGARTALGMVGLAGSVAIAAIGVVLLVRRPASRTLFRLIIGASFLVAAQVALSGSRLVW